MRLPFFFSLPQALPLILQTEMSECGLASLAMVAAYHGHKISLSGLRLQHPVSSRGANLKQLIDIADRIGLQSRPLKLELEHVKDLRRPCILHWDLNHFVVLADVKGGSYTVHDPAFGRKVLTQREFSKHFTGVALELSPKQGFQTLTMKLQLKLSQLFEGAQGYKISLVQVFILSLMLLVLTASLPLFMQLIMDEVLISYDQQLLLLLVLGLVAVTVFQFAAGLLRGFLTLFIGNGLNYHASARVFQHLLRLPLRFFERRHIGDVMSRFHALEPLRKFLTEGLVEVVLDGVMMIFMLGFMLVYSAQLSGVVLLTVLLYAALRFAFFPAFKRLTEEAIVAEAKQSSNFMETVRGIQSIKLYGGEPERHSQWLNLYTQQQNAQASQERFRVWFMVAKNGLYGLEKALILYLGVKLVFVGEMSAGMLIAFLSYKEQFSEKVANLIEQALHYRMLGVHLERLADIALHETEASSLPTTEALAPVQGAIELKDLGYRFDADGPWVFRGLNLRVSAGESLAIIGPSGCGKTTLLKIVVGLLEADEGQVLIDGQDLKVQKTAFQKHIATVMQDDHLLSGSMIDNIAFFDSQPDIARVQACAAAAAIHDDILRMPMRYNSLIGDMGHSLSGGQKQRILLARALYRQPQILFMDEATSHLDQFTESIINGNIRRMAITRVIIAHRLETILSADRIYRMVDGQLIPMEKEEFQKTVPLAIRDWKKGEPS
jgi:ATP-binding cassette subfamily B protein RaxB